MIKGDITDGALLEEALKDIDVLIHLAAAMGGSLLSRDEFHRINVLGTETILNAAEKAGVKKILHFSSAGVLGSVKKNEIADELYPLHPISAYDKTKLEGERIALSEAPKDVDVLVIRPGWVYGPGDRRTFKLIQAIAKKRFALFTQGIELQTPIYIDDLLQGILLVMERGKSGEIYNLAGDEILNVRKMVETIGAATGRHIPKLRIPRFALQVVALTMEKAFRLFKREAPLTRGKLAFFIHPKPLSIEKAKKDLGYAPQINFSMGMEKAILWYREHGWL